MRVVNDCNNHGYTIDDNDNTWYWKLTDNDVSFRRDAGYPVSHPINQQEAIPQSVKQETREQMLI